jgi:hypothetical protein
MRNQVDQTKLLLSQPYGGFLYIATNFAFYEFFFKIQSIRMVENREVGVVYGRLGVN